MISTMTSQSTSNSKMQIVEEPTTEDGNMADNASSSLSELEDEVSSDDDLPEPLAGLQRLDELANSPAEADSEAETERLDITPSRNKMAVPAFALPQSSPSKLSTVTNAEREDNEDDSADIESILDELPLSSPSPTDTDPALLETTPKQSNGRNLGKRKRPSPSATPYAHLASDEPTPKRPHSLADNLQLQVQNAATVLIDLPADPQVELDEEAIVEEVADAASVADEPLAEPVEEEQRVPSRGRTGRRGRKKGKREAVLQEAEVEASDTPAREGETAADEDVDEEDDHAHDEEVAKRKVAAEALSAIEKDFATFREAHLKQQLQQVDRELAMLHQPDCDHPDYLARLACIDEWRDNKLRYEDTLLKYNLQSLVTKTIAERGQLLSQYHQDVREIRDKALDTCYTELYALQKDRRRFGDDENTSMLYDNRKMQLIQQQPAYNMEVSILSSMAKHVGFPAAPRIDQLSPAEIQQDLEIMDLNRRPSANLLRTQGLQDTTPAGEQFIERTPWLNPQHPAHAHAPVSTFHTQTHYSTPAQQRHLPDNVIVNGSASTVEMLSNPPSSAMGPHHANPQDIHIETPIPISRIGKSSKNADRIQTTHNSSDNIFSNSAPHPAESQLSYDQMYQQPRTTPMSANNNASISRAIRAESLGQAPPMAAAIASGGPSGSRFSS